MTTPCPTCHSLIQDAADLPQQNPVVLAEMQPDLHGERLSPGGSMAGITQQLAEASDNLSHVRRLLNQDRNDLRARRADDARRLARLDALLAHPADGSRDEDCASQESPTATQGAPA